MNDFELKAKFPDLEPVNSAPSLWSVNGCGFMLYGSRDYDRETSSSVQTYCLCLLFVPVLALRSYRVVKSGYNSYILGKVPLSGLAKIWNLLLFVSLLVGAGAWGWTAYQNSPGQIAYRQLVKAQQQFAAGQFAEGAALYQEVASGETERAAQARTELQKLLAAPETPDAGRLEVARVAVALAKRGRWATDNGTLTKGLRERATTLGAKDPVAGLALCELCEPIETDRPAWQALHLDLLVRAVKQDPKNPELVSKLAVAYEAEEKLAECEQLLVPLKDRLGILEGARILGQILVRQGKHDDAYALLFPYTEQRLTQLHAAEQRFKDTVNGAEQRVIDRLQNGSAAGFDFKFYELSGEKEQKEQVLRYLSAQLRDDATIQAAQEQLQQAAAVVPAALDLGLVLLRRAQELTDPAERKSELERAEKVFLAVNGVASNNDQYRLYLGQVYYWLGKHDEGHKLFEELLASQGRSHQILMGVAELLIQVGEVAESRRLCEEAYRVAQNDSEKFNAAGLRTTMRIDLDDRITWLDRCDPANMATQALLASSRGELAIRNGNPAEAERLLRESIDIYGREVESDASLNNAALVCFTLFQVSGDTAALDKGAAMLEKAAALNPSDSRVIGNAAEALLRSSLGQVLKPHLDLPTLKDEGSWELFSFLYDDEAGRKKLMAEVRQNRGVLRATSYFEKARLLSPKRVDFWATLAGIHSTTDNNDALRTLVEQMAQVEFDTAEQLRQAKDAQSGKFDERNKAEVAGSIARTKSVLEAARAKNPATFAVAVQDYVSSHLAGEYVNQEVDYGPLLQLAEEAYEKAPSVGSRRLLRQVLFARARPALTAQDPKFAELVTHTKRTLSPEYHVIWALSRADAFSKQAAEHADVQRALALIRESHAKFPESPDEWDWASLRTTDPDLVATMVDVAKQDEQQQLSAKLAQHLSPYSLIGVLHAVWRAELSGAPDDAAKRLKDLADLGIAAPTP